MIRLAANEPPAWNSLSPCPDRASPSRRGCMPRIRRAASVPPAACSRQGEPARQLRVDAWIDSGSEVPAFYDPMLAKLIAHAPTRAAAIEQLDAALAQTAIYGIETNLEYLRTILRQHGFTRGVLHHPIPEFGTAYQLAHARGAAARHALHGAGLARAAGLLGRRRAAIGADGQPRVPTRQPIAREMARACAALELTVTGPTLKFG
jgi:urea carboxylase